MSSPSLAAVAVVALLATARSQDPIQVEAAPVVKGLWPAAIATRSVVEPTASVTLRSEIDGLVEEVLVAAGDQVEKDQVLAVLRGRERRVAPDAARAALDRAEVQLERSRLEAEMAGLSVRTAQVALAAVQADRDRTKERQALALTNLQRVEALQQAGSIGPGAIEQARLEVTEVQAEGRGFAHRVDAAKIEVERAQKALEAARLAIREAEAGIATARLDVDLASIALRALEIRAPIAGTILDRHVSAGETVRGFETPMFELVDLDRVRIRVLTPWKDDGHIALGAKVWIRRDPLASDAEEGAITRLAMRVQKDAGGQFVREALVEFQNRDRRWLVDDECSAWLFPERGSEPALAVPATTIVEIDGVACVYYMPNVQGPTAARRAKVTLGRREGDQVEVLSGLPASKYLIVDCPPAGLSHRTLVVLATGKGDGQGR